MIKKLLRLFTPKSEGKVSQNKPPKPNEQDKSKSIRKGELGEYKINIQLDQLPKECKYLSDLLIANPKSKTGYSQIDHVVISTCGLFVIETKNYSGEIRGSKSEKYWTVNNKFKMYNPLYQNYGHIKAIKEVLRGHDEMRVISMVSFTMRCRFGIDPTLRQISSDDLVIYDVELSEYIQRKQLRLSMEKVKQMTEAEINQVYDLLKQANITDSAVRARHAEKAKR